MELIRTLLCYEFYDEGKDVGQTVRDKSKQILSLLNDRDRLKNERTKMTNSRQVYAQNTAGVKGIASPPANEDLKNKKKLKSLGSPTALTSGSEEDEDLQLQLALAMSREEHEEEEKKKKMEEMRLQMALEESRRLYGTNVGDDDGSLSFGTASNHPDTEEVKPHKPLGQRLTLLSIATAQTSNHTPSPDDLLVSIGSDISRGNGAGPTDNVSDPWQDLALTLSPDEAAGPSMPPPDPWGQTSHPNNGISSLSHVMESFDLLDIKQSPSSIPWPAPSNGSNFGELSAFSDNIAATNASSSAWPDFPTNNFATTGLTIASTGFTTASTGFTTASTGFTPSIPANSTLFSPTNPFHENYLPQKKPVLAMADPWSTYPLQLTSDLPPVSQGAAYTVPPLPYQVSLPSSGSMTSPSATPGFIPQPMPRTVRNPPTNNNNNNGQVSELHVGQWDQKRN